MNIHIMISLPFIGFGVFTFIAETLGYELVFHNSRVSIKKGENVWDMLNIQIMFLSAILYAGSLSSTAGITFFEGYSWLRPGNAVAPFLGYFFGIPGCVGVAVGELFADSFSGYYSWGSIGGFLGNFALAYVPYKVLHDPPLRGLKDVSYFVIFGAIGSTLLCAYIILGLLDIINLSGLMHPIPIIGGAAPQIQVLSEEQIWRGLFEVMIMNNIPMNLFGGALILIAFGYLSERGLFWRDRLGLFEPEKSKRKLWASLALGVMISYAIYSMLSVLDMYGKIGRSIDYLDNLLGILSFAVGILGFLVVSVNVVKRRILSIIMGSRSVDARALEVYFAARREVTKESSLSEATGENLAALLFAKVLYPKLSRLLRRLKINNFVEDYLRYIMFYMMNSSCLVRRSAGRGRIILVEDCMVCKDVSSNTPACGLFTGFLRGLTSSFIEIVKNEHPKVHAEETECKALGSKMCKIKLSWEN